jgi:hypothetical protein
VVLDMRADLIEGDGCFLAVLVGQTVALLPNALATPGCEP